MEGKPKPVSKLCSSPSSSSTPSSKIKTKTRMSALASHCIFCLKLTPPQIDSASDSIIGTAGRAVSLLERHLSLEPGSNQDYNVCRSCASTLEAFYGYYEQIKELELKLEGEVVKLRRVVETANRVPKRRAYVTECYLEGKGLLCGMEQMYAWRSAFSRKCSLKKESSSKYSKISQSKLSAHPNISPQPEHDESGLWIHHQIPVDIKVEVEIPSSGPSSPTSNEDDIIDDEPPPSSSNSSTYDQGHFLPDDDDDENPPPRNPVTPKVTRSSNKMEDGVPPSGRWCSVCSTPFRDNADLKRHFKSTHDLQSAGLIESQSVKCSECPAYFLNSTQLVRHITHSHQDSNRSIPNPGTPGTASNSSKTGNKRYYCTGCPRWFFTSASRKGHFIKNHQLEDADGDADVVKCDKPGCSAYFRTPAQLQKHKVEFHDEGTLLKDPVNGMSFVCTQCGEAFKTQYKLKLHRQMKHKVGGGGARKSFQCETCGAVLGSKVGFNLHLLRHAGTDAYRFQCETCGMKCINKEKLNRHMRTHNNKKRKKKEII